MKQLELFGRPHPDRVAPWRALGALVSSRDAGVSGTALDVVGVAAPVVQCGRYAWALLEVEERGRRAWAHLRVAFADTGAAERLDPELVEHVACCVEGERDRAEYLHDCGVGQWLHMLTEPGLEERRVA